MPGVGKSTIIRELMECGSGIRFVRHGTGDKMFEIGRRTHPERIQTRDDLRKKLNPDEHQAIQHQAVVEVGRDCRVKGTVHLIDCHATTKHEGKLLSGLPPENFREYNPDLIVVLHASADAIRARRLSDTERMRGVKVDDIYRQEEANDGMIDLISQLTGVPVIRVTTETEEDKSPAAAATIRGILGVKPVQLYSISPTTSRGGKTSDRILTPDFMASLDEKSQSMADLAAKVVAAATTWSRSRRQPVFVMNNLEAGGVYVYAFDNWATQLQSRDDALEFAGRATQTQFWQNRGRFLEEAEAIQESGDKLRSMEASIIRNRALAQHDLAIISTASEFMKDGRIDDFVYGIAGTYISSDNNEIFYGGHIKARVEDVLNQPNVLAMVADSCIRGRCRSFTKYNKLLFLGRRGELEEVYGKTVGTEGDWIKRNVLFLDPGQQTGIAATNRREVWWDEIPGIIYPAHTVECDTSLGPMGLRDFFGWRIRQHTGWVERRQGWEAAADKALAGK